MIKNNLSNDFFTRTSGFADILQEAYGSLPNIGYLKTLGSKNRPLSGGVNMGKGRKIQTHGPFELNSLFFRGLLKTLTTFRKFSVEEHFDLIISVIQESTEMYIPQKPVS